METSQKSSQIVSEAGSRLSTLSDLRISNIDSLHSNTGIPTRNPLRSGESSSAVHKGTSKDQILTRHDELSCLLGLETSVEAIDIASSPIHDPLTASSAQQKTTSQKRKQGAEMNTSILDSGGTTITNTDINSRFIVDELSTGNSNYLEQLPEPLRSKYIRRAQRINYLAKKGNMIQAKKIVYASDEEGFDRTLAVEDNPVEISSGLVAAENYAGKSNAEPSMKKRKVAADIPSTASSFSPTKSSAEDHVELKTSSAKRAKPVKPSAVSVNAIQSNEQIPSAQHHIPTLQPHIPQTLAYNASLLRQGQNIHAQSNRGIPCPDHKRSNPLRAQEMSAQDTVTQNALQTMMDKIGTIRGQHVRQKLQHPIHQGNDSSSTMALKMLESLSRSQSEIWSPTSNQTATPLSTPQITNTSQSTHRTPLMQPPPYAYAGIQPRLHQSIDPSSLKYVIPPQVTGINQSEGQSPVKDQNTHTQNQQKTPRQHQKVKSPYFPPKSGKKKETPKSRAPRKSPAKPVMLESRQPTSSVTISPNLQESSAQVAQQTRSVPQVIIPKYSPSPSPVVVAGTNEQNTLRNAAQQPHSTSKTDNAQDAELDEGIDVVHLVPTDNAVGSRQL